MKIQYRPEIDGLRAIAVLSVIVYHAQFVFSDQLFLNGGYVGVDIFFVISGYLITSLILKEINTNSNFSFRYFYERRARRLLPILFVIILASFPLAWKYLTPINFVQFSESVLFSLGFNSNHYFHFSGLEYGNENSLLKPFLHTWSLSVEEQFYIIFPISVVLILRLFKINLLKVFFTVFIISLILAELGSKNFSSQNFYFLHSRMWELTTGSILAYIEINTGKRSENQLLNKSLPFVGLMLILFSVIFFYDGMPHPSIRTLIPVIGVSLIIWFANTNDLITKILSSKAFVGVGLISYSLYMWHFPIFAFKRERSLLSLDNQDKLELILICIILSIVSYFLVEKNFRNKKIISTKFFWYITSTFILIIILLSTVVINKKGFINRITDKQLLELFDIAPRLKLKDEKGVCFDRNDNFCSFGNSNNKKVYLVGDSTIGAFSHLLKDELIERQYNFVTLVQSGCYYLPGFNRIKRSNGEINKDCSNDFHTKIRGLLNKDEDNIVILGGNLNLYLNNTFVTKVNESKNWWYKFRSIDPNKDINSTIIESINELLNNNVNVILLYPIPELDFDLQKKLFLKIESFKSKKQETFFHNYLTENPITFDIDKYDERSMRSFKILDQINHPNLYKIYPKNLLCPNTQIKKCKIYENKKFLYYDGLHLGEAGAKIISSAVIDKVNKISNSTKK